MTIRYLKLNERIGREEKKLNEEKEIIAKLVHKRELIERRITKEKDGKKLNRLVERLSDLSYDINSRRLNLLN